MGNRIEFEIVDQDSGWVTIQFTAMDESVRGTGLEKVIHAYHGVEMYSNNRPAFRTRGHKNKPTLWLPGRVRDQDRKPVKLLRKWYQAVTELISVYNTVKARSEEQADPGIVVVHMDNGLRATMSPLASRRIVDETNFAFRILPKPVDERPLTEVLRAQDR